MLEPSKRFCGGIAFQTILNFFKQPITLLLWVSLISETRSCPNCKQYEPLSLPKRKCIVLKAEKVGFADLTVKAEYCKDFKPQDISNHP